MDIDLGLSSVQDLVVPIAILGFFAFVGLKRGWKGQLVATSALVVLGGAFRVAGSALVQSANTLYRSLLTLAFCGQQTDPLVCPRAADLARATLVDPNSPDQTRTFLLASVGLTCLAAYIVILRFGKAPSSVLHRLLGALTGVVNGFLAAYLVLPLVLQSNPVLLASSEAAEESSARIAQHAPAFAEALQQRASLIFLAFLVLFVVVAVRVMRPIKPQSDGRLEP
jgi:hypothetical protein